MSRILALLLGAALVAAPLEAAFADPPGRGDRDRERRRDGPARAERLDRPPPRFAPREGSPGRTLNPDRPRPQLQAGPDRRRDDRDPSRRRDDSQRRDRERQDRDRWRNHDDHRPRHVAPYRPPVYYHPPPRPPVYVVRPPVYVAPPVVFGYAPYAPPPPVYVVPSPPPVVYGPETVSVAPVAGYGIAEGTCNRGAIGALLGAGTGAFVGNQAGNGGVGATIAGGILGAMVGGLIGNAMDEVDHNCVGQTLEQARTNQTVTWVGATPGESYTVQPTRTWQQPDGRPCREYTTTAVIGGQANQAFGTACRNPDGSWQIVN